MEKGLLRLIYQKRFKLMNRWNAEAMFLQPKFGTIGDPVFRSMIFRAFDDVVQQLRRAETEEPATGGALLDQMEFLNPPDLNSYCRAWQLGGEVLEDFCRKDATCLKRFSLAERELAKGQIREAIQAIQTRETAAHQRLVAKATPAALYCIRCGRVLKE